MNRNEKFQDVVLKVSKELINYKIEDYDRKINEALELIGSFLDVDRVYVFDYIHEENIMNNTYEWCNKGVSKEIDNLQGVPMELVQAIWVDFHLSGRPAIYERVIDLPEDEILRQILEPQGIKSVTTIPMMDGDFCLGFVGFDDIRNERHWNESEMNLLSVLAEVITNARLKEEQQQKLIKLKKQADEASLEKSQFLAKISHEFRTPLHGITNALYLLNATKLNSEQKNYFDIAQYSTESLTSMINELLDIAKIENGEMEIFEDVFDLENEMVNLIQSFKAFAEEKALNLTLDYDYKIKHHLLGDYGKIRQILNNLISNALKYTRNGGVYVKVQQTENQSDQLKIKFTVKDTGIGMDEAHIHRIFDKFYQIDQGDSRKYQGTGLGLSIVKQLIEKLNSKIDVTSKKDKGTMFEFELELKKDEAYDYKEIHQLKVLFARNSEGLNSLKNMLNSMQLEVVEQAVKGQTYDVIVFDDESIGSMTSYQTEYGKPNTVYIKFGDVERINDDRIQIYIHGFISRRVLYQRMVRALKEQKAPIQTFDTQLSGYALIVDDNRLNRIALENILKKEGIKSKLVESGMRALEVIQKEHFDIILMDIQMPEMDGIETTKRIRALGNHFLHIPVVAVTANAFLNDYDLMKDSTMDDVLFKPIKIDALEQILRKHLAYQKQLFVPSKFVIFNQADYMHRFDGSEDIAKTVVDTFVVEYQKDLIKIEDVLKTKNTKEIRAQLHYFKGSCAYLSGQRATWLLTTMMKLADDNDLKALDKAYDVLVYEVDKLIEALKQFKEKL